MSSKRFSLIRSTRAPLTLFRVRRVRRSDVFFFGFIAQPIRIIALQLHATYQRKAIVNNNGPTVYQLAAMNVSSPAPANVIAESNVLLLKYHPKDFGKRRSISDDFEIVSNRGRGVDFDLRRRMCSSRSASQRAVGAALSSRRGDAER